MKRPTTLRARTTLVLAAVAAVAVIITGAVTVPLVRNAAVASARERVGAQVELLAAIGAPMGSDAAQGTMFAVIRGDVVRGGAAQYATKTVRTTLERTGTFSGTVRSASGAAIVEARSTAQGLEVIGAFPLREVERSQSQATLRVLLALAAGLAVAVLAGWLLARWLAGPLASTASAARRLAAGERGVPMPTGGPLETREVTMALTALDSALTASEGRQREFLLSVSHELRTPLSAIRGYGEALTDRLIAESDIADVGRTLVSETERIDRFVADLLALARLEADDFELEIARVELGELARDAVTAWEGRAATLGVGLHTAVDEVAADGDTHRIRQVLDGLIENALRATPEGGSVTVRVAAESPRTALIEVADTGPGLSADDAAVAFDRGVLRARYRDSRPVGTGLGLSISARLVERLGGTIDARPGDHGGAVFRVLLNRMDNLTTPP